MREDAESLGKTEQDEIIQNPSMNKSHQYHSNMDVTDLIVEDDLKLNAVLIATFVYQVAMRDEMLTRKLKTDIINYKK